MDDIVADLDLSFCHLLIAFVFYPDDDSIRGQSHA